MNTELTQGIERVLITSEQLKNTVSELGARISRDYAGKNPLMVSVLKGAFIFMADLVREITVPCTVDFMAVSSYGKGAKSSGQVQIIKDLDTNIEGRHVILVEDILDSGVTLSYLLELLRARRPASVRLCALLDKPARRKVPVEIDYRGLTVPDEFIVGYGLDYAEQYRNYPEIAVLKREMYETHSSQV